MLMITARQILNDKGYDVWSISPDATVYEALQLMAEKNVGALVVLDRREVVGLISERDYARKVVLKGKTSLNTPVRKIMTSKVVSVCPKQSAEECMALMTDQRTRHLPVLEDGRLVGIVSIGDVVKKIIHNQEFTIQQLDNYITGSVTW